MKQKKSMRKHLIDIISNRNRTEHREDSSSLDSSLFLSAFFFFLAHVISLLLFDVLKLPLACRPKSRRGTD